MMGLHIGRSPAYSAEMMPDPCGLGSPTSFLISSPTSSHRPRSTEPHMAGLASRSELLQRRSMASTGPPAGRPHRREGQQRATASGPTPRTAVRPPRRAGLTIFDAVIAWLTYREYRKQLALAHR
jgi:hypothetical protein